MDVVPFSQTAISIMANKYVGGVGVLRISIHLLSYCNSVFNLYN